MQAEDFEWDEIKASENYASMASASKRRAPYSRMSLQSKSWMTAKTDDRENYGEDRFTIVGMSDGTLLFVAYTLRGTRIRLISARRATKHEQDDYYQQNG